MTAFQDIDVFLCHNSKDKPVVLKIAEPLQKSGLNVWIDRHNISSGVEFQRAIQEAIPRSKSAAIFFSSYGEGPWQSQEINALEREMVKGRMFLIPILLPGVNQIPNERLFLQGRNWLSFSDKEFIDKLVRSIKEQNSSNLNDSNFNDDLSSEHGVNYTQLRDLLKARQWEEADQKTLAVMLKAAGREQEGWLDVESIKNFPCTDLRTIDQLWVKYSEGHFGFSVQKRIWESEGKDYENFGDRVGWRKQRMLLFWKRRWRHYNELTFTNARGDFPQGHLPGRFVFIKTSVTSLVWYGTGGNGPWYPVETKEERWDMRPASFLSRIETCKL